MTEPMEKPDRSRAEMEALIAGVLAGERRALAKAITRIENRRAEGRTQAHEIVSRLMPHSGKAVRIGVSGVPGVGKSTFIESFGLFLIDQGFRVAVLAVDPSSQISGGSIMGDKVRMEHLARNPASFIRPSPSSGSLGGVARRTRESMLLCEAAGYDVVIVETVGVGQSEIAVSEMVDFFLVLMLPNAGDEIQGIKKGILEMADGLVINKADGGFKQAANQAKRFYQSALHLTRPKRKGWQTPVITCSALHREGMDRIWTMIQKHRQFLEQVGGLSQLRASQLTAWFHAAIRDEILDRLYADTSVQDLLEASLAAVRSSSRSPYQAAEEVVAKFLGD